MDDKLPIPGGNTPISSRPLHFFFLADCSGSMNMNGKIQALNQSIREAIKPMREAAADQPRAQLLVRAIKFSAGAQWHVGTPTSVNDFVWPDLTAEGPTDMGAALRLVAGELRSMPQRALPPVVVIATDGEPTDDFGSGLQELMAQPWGKRAVRIGIAIGQDANLEYLRKFIGLPPGEREPLQANNPEKLVQFIRWASTQVVNSVASPMSRTDKLPSGSENVYVPPPADAAQPTGTADPGIGDVW